MVEYRIVLVPNARPIRQAPYRLHSEKLRCIDSQIANLLEEATIAECSSAWAALTLVVSNLDGTGGLCVDFRRLNGLTELDPFPMPRINSLLDRLGGDRFVTKHGMMKAYFQVPIAPQDKPLTCIVTNQGHFQWR